MVVGRDGLLLVEKATDQTVLVRSALLAAAIDHVINDGIVGYDAHEHIYDVKNVQNCSEFNDINYETGRKIRSDIVHIEETYNIA